MQAIEEGPRQAVPPGLLPLPARASPRFCHAGIRRQHSAQLCWWSGLAAVAAQRALSTTLLELLHAERCAAGPVRPCTSSSQTPMGPAGLSRAARSGRLGRRC